jgi:y4mF family transcriptional regulator
MIRELYQESVSIADFVKIGRKRIFISQKTLALQAGVGLRFVRELEQGKKTLRLDKVNQVLDVFHGMVVAVRKPNLKVYEEISDVLAKERRERENIIRYRLEVIQMDAEEREAKKKALEDFYNSNTFSI